MPKISDKTEKPILEDDDMFGIDDGVSGVTKMVKAQTVRNMDHLESIKNEHNLIQRQSNNTFDGDYNLVQGEDNDLDGSPDNHRVVHGKANQINGNYAYSQGESNLGGGDHTRTRGKGCSAANDYADASGYGCAANGIGSVATGAASRARNYGEKAHSSGYFQTMGDAQFSQAIMRKVCPFSVATELFLNGVDERFTIPDHRIISMRIHLTGVMHTANAESVYQVWDALLRRIDGNAGYEVDDVQKREELIVAGITAPGLTISNNIAAPGDGFKFLVTNNEFSGDMRVVMRLDINYLGEDTISGGGGGFDDPIAPDPTA